jgi:hypothetical protein
MSTFNRFTPDTLRHKRVVVVHHDPSAGYRVADRLALHGYQAIVARTFGDVQQELPHIRQEVIVVDSHLSSEISRVLPYLRFVYPHVSIIAMARGVRRDCDDKLAAQVKASLGSGVFLCEPPDSQHLPARYQ